MKNFPRTSLAKQRGYLIMVAAVIICLAGILSVMMISLSADSATSTALFGLGEKSYYIAAGGLEEAARNLFIKNVDCPNITGNTYLTNASLGGGTFTVTGANTKASTTISGNVTAAAATIPLTSVTGFASSGLVLIDNELIYYSSLSGNSLANVIRGVWSSVPAAHTSGAAVVENQCLLTSAGATPSLTASNGKRTLEAITPTLSFSLDLNTPSGTYNSALFATAGVNLAQTSTVQNPFVVAGSNNFSGSTIFTSSTVTFNNTAKTEVNSSSGMVTSSTSGSIQGDVIQNNTTITAANLFSYFFSQPAATIQAGANQTYNSSNINGATGKTIWTSGLSLTSGTTVGSAVSPVILIVNGNLTMTSGVTIYGFVYVFNSLTMNGGTINGAAASELAVNLNNASSIVYNPTVLAAAQALNTNTNINYLSPLLGYQEVFS